MTIRPIEESEYDPWMEVQHTVMNLSAGANPDEFYHPSFGIHPWINLDRSVGVFKDSNIVATSHSFSLEMNIPGNCLPMAGVSHVTVLPTHRRQGILREMIRYQIDSFQDNSEPLSSLSSSESAIYGRFGYGIAVFKENWVIQIPDNFQMELPSSRGQTIFIDHDQITNYFPLIYSIYARDKNAMVRVPDFHWYRKALRKPSNFNVVFEKDKSPLGYAAYEINGSVLIVDELVAVTAEAYFDLWNHIFSFNHVRTVKADKRSQTELLPHMLSCKLNFQRIVSDGLWLRLIDAPSALAKRDYATPGRINIKVVDTFCPWNENTYELLFDGINAQCTRTETRPDIVISAADLASIYLGGAKLSDISALGRVDEITSGSIQKAGDMFKVDIPEICPFGW